MVNVLKRFGRQTPRRWGWGIPLKKRSVTRIKNSSNQTFYSGNLFRWQPIFLTFLSFGKQARILDSHLRQTKTAAGAETAKTIFDAAPQINRGSLGKIFRRATHFA